MEILKEEDVDESLQLIQDAAKHSDLLNVYTGKGGLQEAILQAFLKGMNHKNTRLSSGGVQGVSQ